jgi:flagellin
MPLGVLNNISAIYAQNSLTNTQASLQKTLQQLSTGSRINSGADDAAGLSIVNGLDANSAALTQSSANATDGIGLLQVADGALSQVTSLLNRAITLSTEAANGTLNTTQLAAAQQEYGDILSEINTIGSSTVFNGNAVFSNTTTNIFTSDGTGTGTTNYSVGVGTLNTATGVGDVAPNTSASTLTALPINTKVGGAAVAYSAAAADIYTLTGASSTDVVTASSTNPFAIQVGSTVYSIAVPSTGETLTALAGQINSTLGSAISSATVSAAGVLTITGLVGSAHAVTLINAHDLYDTSGTAAAVAVAQTGTATNTVAYAPASTETYQINAASATDTFTDNGLSVTIGGVTSSVYFSGTGGVDTQTQLIADIYAAVGSNYTVAAGAAPPSAADIVIAATATGSASNFTFSGSVTDQLATTSSSSSTSGIQTPGIVLSGTDLNTHSDAATALLDIYKAIGDVAYQRGAVGANVNTLTAVSNVETTQNVNIDSASNSINATDYGAATSNLSKYEILSQTGISALAQANSVQQEVLKLLQ